MLNMFFCIIFSIIAAWSISMIFSLQSEEIVLKNCSLPLETCCLFTDKSSKLVLQSNNWIFSASGKQGSPSMIQVPTLELKYNVQIQSFTLRLSNWSWPSVCCCTETYLGGLSISLQASGIKCKRICEGEISRVNIWAWESADLLLNLAYVGLEKKCSGKGQNWFLEWECAV